MISTLVIERSSAPTNSMLTSPRWGAEKSAEAFLFADRGRDALRPDHGHFERASGRIQLHSL